MLRTVKFTLTAIAAFVGLASTANAAAVYTWIGNSQTGGTGTLTLSDDAYFAGGTQGTLAPYEGRLWYDPSPTAPFGTVVLDSSPLTIQTWIGTPGVALAFDMAPPWDRYGHNSSLKFNFMLTVEGDGLSGFLHFEDGNAIYAMSGNGGLWGNFEATTDNHPTECLSGHVDECDVEGGRWVLTSAPTRPGSGVPEPASIVLLLVGAGGMLSRRIASRFAASRN